MAIAGCQSNPSTNGRTLKVMTYNIHYGADASGHFDLERTARVIAATGADIIALQEVDRGWGARSGFMDEVAYLADYLDLNFAFGATLDNNPGSPNTGKYGLAILSRFPIVDSMMHLLPSELEQRGVLLAWIALPSGNIPVASIHLGLSTSDRQQQVTETLNWLPVSEDLILMGDFNTESDAPEVRMVTERLRDVQKVCGLGEVGTFFYENQWVRIDYIFAGANWEIVDCEVIADPASDHYPVVVKIRS